MDSKGRFFLPPLFRRAVEDGDPNFQPGQKPELVIVYGDETREYLEGFTMMAMEQLDAKIDRLQSGPLKRRLERMYSGQSIQTEVDGEGRVLLPPKVREKLEIEGEVYLIASGQTFKIWRKDVFDAHYEKDMEEDDGLPPGVDLLDAMDAELAKLDQG